MTLAVDERLEVDSVDSFLILRSPDPVQLFFASGCMLGMRGVLTVVYHEMIVGVRDRVRDLRRLVLP